MAITVLLLGLAVGVLVGLLGIGGGVVLVPAMIYLLHMDQHLAQGTSLFILLPPIGLGALREYWKAGNVDLRAGIFCAVGIMVGAYVGSKFAVPMSTQKLKGMFGIGGGVILVPILGLLLGFSQHRAQGTSLVALIPPTGLLALIAYAHAGYVSWQTGLLLIPGVFLGGIAGGSLAKKIPSAEMRRIFAALMFLLGISQIMSALRG